MSLLQFTLPPLLHYIVSGYTVFAPGDRHVARCNVEVFDLLFVTDGCLYIEEENRRYEVREGTAAILRPDACHSGYEGCRESTGYYWLHFQTAGSWAATDAFPPPSRAAEPDEEPSQIFETRTFPLLLPRFARVPHPNKMAETLRRLTDLAPGAHVNEVRFRQQLLFQEAVQQLSASIETARTNPGTRCAEQAAEFLRGHYREEISAKRLGDELSFHPVYIARCMQQEYGCSPMDYLIRYRIGQSKLLLLRTDLPIARIAEEVGFRQSTYFSSTFARLEGISPRQYRHRFRQG